jgi:hypothetical protein
MLTNNRPASYGNTGTIQEVTDAHAERLIAEAIAGTLTPSDSYGETKLRAVEFILAGGGPGSDVTILLDRDGDVHSGFYSYYEPGGTATAPLDRRSAERIWKLLKPGRSA